jgi:hypothetical protein
VRSEDAERLAMRCTELGLEMPTREDLVLLYRHALYCLDADFGRIYTAVIPSIMDGRLEWEWDRLPLLGPMGFLLETVDGRLPPVRESPDLCAAVAKIRRFHAALTAAPSE